MASLPGADSVDHRAVADANRRFYARTAHAYEATENCLVDRRKQALLERLLDDAVARSGRAPGEMVALDACGGSGNVSMKLLRRGLAVTNVDVSPEMHDLFRAKLRQSGLDAEIQLREIADFLRDSTRRFDLVVFSSALHHLKDLEAVMDLVSQRLRPGGALLTVFDPTLRSELSTAARAVLWLDYVGWKLFRQTGDVVDAVRRRLARRRAGMEAAPGEAFDGFIAEYRARSGIDDAALRAFLVSRGFAIVSHARLPEARYRIPRWLLRGLGARTEFTILAERPE
jgi:2-polyprenyl-3-methyl-5-hydroxy-6-metoxy-1,4-benzoquinol methylase